MAARQPMISTEKMKVEFMQVYKTEITRADYNELTEVLCRMARNAKEDGLFREKTTIVDIVIGFRKRARQFGWIKA